MTSKSNKAKSNKAKKEKMTFEDKLKVNNLYGVITA
jgi:hypothetical protein